MAAPNSESYQRQHILLSSEHERPDLDDLPPSDPPEEIETDDEQIDLERTEENPFLTSYNSDDLQDIPIATSDDIPFRNNEVNPTSEDIPLASMKHTRLKVHYQTDIERTKENPFLTFYYSDDPQDIPFATSDDIPLRNDAVDPTSEDIPLASIKLRVHRQTDHRTRLRSSSLPTPVQTRIATSDDILFTPRTERKHRMALMTQKRFATMAQKARELEAREKESKERFFDKTLQSFHDRGISLAEFLKYVFNPEARHVVNWKWRGFFQQTDTVKEIFGYWTGSGSNKTTQKFITNWVIEQAKKIVAQESKAISDSKILLKGAKMVDEAFFLNFSLESITANLRELAPQAFVLFDAFSTTERQKKELKERSRKRQELVCIQA
jgi:hypothetical protein